jgi:hypothetical protein
MMEWIESYVAIFALHKCGIERAHTFELLKLLNNTKILGYFPFHMVSKTIKYYACFCVSYC